MSVSASELWRIGKAKQVGFKVLPKTQHGICGPYRQGEAVPSVGAHALKPLAPILVFTLGTVKRSPLLDLSVRLGTALDRRPNRYEGCSVERIL